MNNLKNLNLEINKRIINNLIYLYKSKGTEKCIRQFFNCYGIPQSLMQFYNYGEFSYKNDSYSEVNTPYIKKENFNYVLNFNGSENIRIPKLNCKTIEISFKITENINTYLATKKLFQTELGTYVSLTHTYNEFGTVTFFLDTDDTYTTDEIPIFNGNLTTISLQYVDNSNYLASVTQHINNRKVIDIYHTITDAGSYSDWFDSYLDLGYSNFYGMINEFRLWDINLSRSILYIHSKYPESLIGDNYLSFYDNLLFLLTFSIPKNLSINTTLYNESNNALYSSEYAVASGFSSVVNFPYNFSYLNYYSYIENINDKLNINNNKIFIPTQTLKTINNQKVLKHNETMENIDIMYNSSNIYYMLISPIQLMNDIIIKRIPTDNFIELYGDPRDTYKETFETLNSLRVNFYKYYQNIIKFNDFIRNLKYFNFSIFENIKQFLPSTIDLKTGFLIENTMLESNKVKHIKPTLINKSKNEVIIHTKPFVKNLSKFEKNEKNIKILEKFNIYTYMENIKGSLKSLTKNSVYGKTFSIIKPRIDFYTNSYLQNNINIAPNQEIEDNLDKKYKIYRTAEKRIKYLGCKNTIDTTIDKKQPVSIFINDSNIIVSYKDEKSQLQVK